MNYESSYDPGECSLVPREQWSKTKSCSVRCWFRVFIHGSRHTMCSLQRTPATAQPNNSALLDACRASSSLFFKRSDRRKFAEKVTHGRTTAVQPGCTQVRLSTYSSDSSHQGMVNSMMVDPARAPTPTDSSSWASSPIPEKRTIAPSGTAPSTGSTTEPTMPANEGTSRRSSDPSEIMLDALEKGANPAHKTANRAEHTHHSRDMHMFTKLLMLPRTAIKSS